MTHSRTHFKPTCPIYISPLILVFKIPDLIRYTVDIMILLHLKEHTALPLFVLLVQKEIEVRNRLPDEPI